MIYALVDKNKNLLDDFTSNSRKLKRDDFIVMFGEGNFDLLDFPHPGI